VRNFGIVLIALSLIGAADPITIDKRPPTTQRVIVENPATMPSRSDANANEDAWCQFFFNCSVKLKYDVIDRRPARTGSDMLSVTAKIRRVDVTITLENTLFLPRHSTEKLNAHENGHRRINERVYEDAQDAARAAAEAVMTKSWQGWGPDEDAAGKDATDKAVKELCDQYLRSTADRALRIGRIYDELTNHGRRMNPKEDEAIERAFRAAD
jgi:hypothetical protein